MIVVRSLSVTAVSHASRSSRSARPFGAGAGPEELKMICKFVQMKTIVSSAHIEERSLISVSHSLQVKTS